MKVLLLKEVKNLGRGGEVKEVAVGFARNYLIPQGFAQSLSKSRLAELEAQKNHGQKPKKKKGAKEILGAADKAAEAKRINGKNFTIKVKTDATGSLYAKIDAKTLATELSKQGFKIEPKEIKLEEPLKKAGEYKIQLDLGGNRAEIGVKLVN